MSGTMDHILPEVRPVVTSMPDQTYMAQTDGSARARDLKLDSNNNFFISGVPRHTHNATAIAGIVGDFTVRRTTAVQAARDWYVHDDEKAENLALLDFANGPRFHDSERGRYDRAIEKGIGRIRLVPENCHQSIEEPARAISEIRTIVAAHDQLDSMTYTEEQGSYVDTRTGRDASAEFVSEVNVDLIGYSGFTSTTDFLDRRSSVYIRAHDEGTLVGCYTVKGPGRIKRPGTSAFVEWDGTVPFRFKVEGTGQHARYECEAFTLNLPVIPVTITDADPANDVPGEEQIITFEFDSAVTFPQQDGNCFFAATATGGPYGSLEEEVRAQFEDSTVAVEKGLSCYTDDDQFDTVTYKLFGCPAFRIPTGRAVPLYGPPRSVDAAARAESHHNDLTSLRDAIMIIDGRKMNYLNPRISPVNGLYALVAGGVYQGDNSITPVAELNSGLLDNTKTSDGGFQIFEIGPQKRTVNVTHSMYKYDMPRQVLCNRYTANEGVKRFGGAPVARLQTEAFDLAGDHDILNLGANYSFFTASQVAYTRYHDYDIAYLRGQDIYVDPQWAKSKENFEMFQMVAHTQGRGHVGYAIRRDTQVAQDLLEADHPGYKELIDNLEELTKGGTLSIVPIDFAFIHDGLVVSPIDATAAQKALGTISFVPTGTEIDNARTAAEAMGAAANVIAYHEAIERFAAAWTIYHGQHTNYFSNVGGPLLIVTADDGTEFVYPGNHATPALRNQPYITAAVLARLQANPPTATVDLIWDEALLRRQTVSVKNLNEVHTSTVSPFYAVGDFVSYDSALGAFTTHIDLSALQVGLQSTCNANYRAAISNDLVLTAPVSIVLHANILQRPSDAELNAANTAANAPAAPQHAIDYNTLLTKFLNGAYYGYDVAAANGAVGAAARKVVYETTKAGIGDQFLVPLADISFPAATNLLTLKNYALNTVVKPSGTGTRYAYLFFGDVGRIVADRKYATMVRVDMNSARCHLKQLGNGADSPFVMHTEFVDAVVANPANATDQVVTPFTRVLFNAMAANTPTLNAPPGGNLVSHVLIQMDTSLLQSHIVDNDVAGLGQFMTSEQGLVYRSKRRVTQPLCAPILNPDVRIGCLPPLNFGTRHLPPEMRDFKLTLSDVDFSFLPTPTEGDGWQFEPLKMFQFSGGNQVATAQDSLLYLPEFKHYEARIGNQFDQTIYTSNGMPSYFAFFLRHSDPKEGNNHFLRQPMIETLNIQCQTTKRHSDVVTNDLDKGFLYHMTMRNVHPMSGYQSSRYNMRQVVLLAAEDVGLMSLKTTDYQQVRRVRFQITGKTNGPGQLHMLLIYNNRGLEVFGADLKVVRL